MPQTRQLTVILFADIEGYTRLMHQDEVSAITILDKFRTAFKDQTRLHGGCIHKWSGDGALCSFNSAVEAVNAAIEIQKQMIENPVVPLRIGIHAADVMLQENDLYGDGVNIASRIESFAVPGSIFISRNVYEDIRNQKNIETVSFGKYKLKNVTEPVEIFAISNKGIRVPKHKTLKGKGSAVSGRKLFLLFASLFVLLAFATVWFTFFNSTVQPSNSIAVLPFVDMSADKNQQYFGDGLSEELLDNLTRVPGLKVIARTSSFSFRDKSEDLRSIGKKLGVVNILEGSVRKSGNQIRITAQLNNAKDGTHIWSETYDRTLDDIFKIQDEIAFAVVQHLKATILKDSGFGEHHGNAEVYNLMLKAKFLWEQHNEDSSVKAIDLCNRALAIDSNDARVWALLSQVYARLAGSDKLGKADGIIKARRSAEKAIALNDELADGYVARGLIKQIYDWDWRGADEDYQKAYDLNPRDAAIIRRKASLSRTLGDFDKAIPLYRKAIELDPLSAGIYNSFAIALVNSNNLEEAKQQIRKALEINPHFESGHSLISGIYLLQQEKDSAYMESQQETDVGWKTSALTMLYYSMGRKAESDSMLYELIAKYRDDYACQIAQSFAWKGDRDQAFYWLEQAYINRDAGLAEMKGNPFLKNIESDARYAVFMKKIGLL